MADLGAVSLKQLPPQKNLQKSNFSDSGCSKKSIFTPPGSGELAAEGDKQRWRVSAERGSGTELSQGMCRVDLGGLSGSAVPLGAAQPGVPCRVRAQELAQGQGGCWR